MKGASKNLITFIGKRLSVQETFETGTFQEFLLRVSQFSMDGFMRFPE